LNEILKAVATVDQAAIANIPKKYGFLRISNLIRF